jgi:lipopolysaccharide export system protein LptA
MKTKRVHISGKIFGKGLIFVIFFALAGCFAHIQAAFAVQYLGQKQYLGHNISVNADVVEGALGKQITASGAVDIVSDDKKMRLQADKVAWFFDIAGKQAKRFEATSKVTFHLNRTDKAGSRMVVDGEGDDLVYNPADGTVKISVRDAGASAKSPRKAHMHVVETPAPTKVPAPAGTAAIAKAPVKASPKAAAKTSPKTGGTTAEMPKEYDIYAPIIVVDLKQRTFTTSGGRAAIETEVLEAVPSEAPAKTEAAPAIIPQVEGK